MNLKSIKAKLILLLGTFCIFSGCATTEYALSGPAVSSVSKESNAYIVYSASIRNSEGKLEESHPSVRWKSEKGGFNIKPKKGMLFGAKEVQVVQLNPGSYSLASLLPQETTVGGICRVNDSDDVELGCFELEENQVIYLGHMEVMTTKLDTIEVTLYDRYEQAIKSVPKKNNLANRLQKQLLNLYPNAHQLECQKETLNLIENLFVKS